MVSFECGDEVVLGRGLWVAVLFVAVACDGEVVGVRAVLGLTSAVGLAEGRGEYPRVGKALEMADVASVLVGAYGVVETFGGFLSSFRIDSVSLIKSNAAAATPIKSAPVNMPPNKPRK